MIIVDPKRTSSQSGRSDWYPYYAGFSYDFARRLLSTADLHPDSIVMDDWNGSGTTTSVADALGYKSYGFDLNPVMVIVAKARLLNKREHSSMEPLGREIIEKAEADTAEPVSDDPLQAWFGAKSACDVRKLETAIQLLLIDHDRYEVPAKRQCFGLMSGLSAFFYLALFRTIRVLLDRFVPSNPTWVKTPRSSHFRLKPQRHTIFEAFQSQLISMLGGGQVGLFEPQESGEVTIDVSASGALPLAKGSVDFALGSPPYCTRIDYAVSTKPELAVLGYTQEMFRVLRDSLLGTATVPEVVPCRSKEWGPTCLKFLEALENHSSKASRSYYLKNHLPYFDGIFKSLSELHRVLNEDGTCVLVIQDSYYKDIKNDLPQIVTEMASSNALELIQREDFSHTRTMAALNPSARRYRKTFLATESVLVFQHSA